MIDKKEIASSVTFQYHTAMKYARQKKIEILVKQGVNHPDINKENIDEETMGILTGWIHNNHFTDNTHNDDCINDMIVDIGQKRTGQSVISKRIDIKPSMEKNILNKLQNNTTVISK
jgi:hypothetical protein